MVILTAGDCQPTLLSITSPAFRAVCHTVKTSQTHSHHRFGFWLGGIGFWLHQHLVSGFQIIDLYQIFWWRSHWKYCSQLNMSQRKYTVVAGNKMQSSSLVIYSLFTLISDNRDQCWRVLTEQGARCQQNLEMKENGVTNTVVIISRLFILRGERTGDERKCRPLCEIHKLFKTLMWILDFV